MENILAIVGALESIYRKAIRWQSKAHSGRFNTFDKDTARDRLNQQQQHSTRRVFPNCYFIDFGNVLIFFVPSTPTRYCLFFSLSLRPHCQHSHLYEHIVWHQRNPFHASFGHFSAFCIEFPVCGALKLSHLKCIQMCIGTLQQGKRSVFFSLSPPSTSVSHSFPPFHVLFECLDRHKINWTS